MLPHPEGGLEEARRGGQGAAVAAALVAAGCSGSAPQSDAHPSVNFGTAAGTAPTMAAGSSANPSATAQAPQAPNAVNIDNFAFAPMSLTVHVGDTVTWTNNDEEPHTVAAGDGSFHSPGMDTGATYSFTFTKAGIWNYHNHANASAFGSVIVH